MYGVTQEDREQITYTNVIRLPGGDDTHPTRVLKDELESICQSDKGLVCSPVELVCNTNKWGFHLGGDRN